MKKKEFIKLFEYNKRVLNNSEKSLMTEEKSNVEKRHKIIIQQKISNEKKILVKQAIKYKIVIIVKKSIFKQTK